MVFCCFRSSAGNAFLNKYETLIEQTFVCQRCLRQTRHSKRLKCSHSLCFDCVYDSLDLWCFGFLPFVKCPLCLVTTYRFPSMLPDSYTEADFEDEVHRLQVEEFNRQYIEERNNAEGGGSDLAWDFYGLLDGEGQAPEQVVRKKTIVATYK